MMDSKVSKQAIDLNPLTIHRLLAAATVTWYLIFFGCCQFLVIFCLYGFLLKVLKKKSGTPWAWGRKLKGVSFALQATSARLFSWLSAKPQNSTELRLLPQSFLMIFTTKMPGLLRAARTVVWCEMLDTSKVPDFSWVLILWVSKACLKWLLLKLCPDLQVSRWERGKNTNGVSRVAHVSFVSIFLIWSRFFLMLRLIMPQCVAYHWRKWTSWRWRNRNGYRMSRCI